ncbi:hypothetical protein MishRS11D_03310 [Methylomagnum ishizawai]|nr:hypothetical protein MishRS11D_03310 [Methylomagnum ishizawai]
MFLGYFWERLRYQHSLPELNTYQSNNMVKSGHLRLLMDAYRVCLNLIGVGILFQNMVPCFFMQTRILTC